MEIVSGDNLGRIFIWWTETGEILRQCFVHKGPIKSMQFDSIHIVSGGTDKCVCITDIATGEVIQTLRGHEKHVLAIAFDYERIISVSADNTLRYAIISNSEYLLFLDFCQRRCIHLHLLIP